MSYSGELRLRPSVVRSEPSARWTIPGSVSAARINVNKPIIPNWSVTMPTGMLVTRPVDVSQHHARAGVCVRAQVCVCVSPSGSTWIPFFCWLLLLGAELLSPGNFGPSELGAGFPDEFRF